jgi:hypothetical protein
MLMDQQPGESPVGMGIASGAIVTALLDKLVSAGILSLPQTAEVVRTALVLVSGYGNSPSHDSARLTLTRMLKDRGGL